MKCNNAIVLSMIFILFFTIAAYPSYSQTKITTEFTSDHKLLKDSKIFIVPPAGCILSANLLAYMHKETGASIAIFQSDMPLSSAQNHLSKEYLLRKNYNIIEITRYEINNLTAIWYELETEFYDKRTIKYILIIGNENEHAMIEAYCPKEHQSYCAELKKSIFSIYYDLDSSIITNMAPK